MAYFFLKSQYCFVYIRLKYIAYMRYYNDTCVVVTVNVCNCAMERIIQYNKQWVFKDIHYPHFSRDSQLGLVVPQQFLPHKKSLGMRLENYPP